LTFPKIDEYYLRVFGFFVTQKNPKNLAWHFYMFYLIIFNSGLLVALGVVLLFI
jgi:hypothetical protein